MRLRFGCGSVAVRLRFGCGSVAVRLRFGCGSVAVRLRFGCGSVAVRLRFGCGRPIKTANDRRNEIALVYDGLRSFSIGFGIWQWSLLETGNRYISKIVIQNKLYH